MCIRLGVLQELKVSVFPSLNLCDFNCKPSSYKTSSILKPFNLHRRVFCVHKKLNDGPVLHKVHWSERFWIIFLALVVHIRRYLKRSAIHKFLWLWCHMKYIYYRFLRKYVKIRSESFAGTCIKRKVRLQSNFSANFSNNSRTYVHVLPI